MRLEAAKSIDRAVGGVLARVLVAATRLARIFRSPSEVTEVRSILLVKLWGLGNIILLYPVIRQIREAYPDARIQLLTLEGNRALAERHPGLDGVLTLPLGSWGRLAFAIPRMLFGLRRQSFDLVLDFEQFCHLSGILARLCGARQTLGFKMPGRFRGEIYHVRVPYREERHMGEIFSDIARACGVPSFPYEPMPVPLDAGDHDEADACLAPVASCRLVAVHAGSGDNFPGRRWPTSSYAAVARALLERDDRVAIVLTGVASEGALVRSVRDAIPAEHRERVIDLAGRTSPGGLASVLSRCRVLLSNDTGPVHLAGAMGVPVFGFFGPNTPLLYGPLGPHARAFYLGLPCSPCITNANAKTSSCRMPVCMKQIDVDSVLAAVEESGVLEEARGGVRHREPAS